MTANLTDIDHAIDSLLAELQPNAAALNGLFADLSTKQAVIRANGFSSDEVRSFKNLGFSDSDIETLRQGFEALDFLSLQNVGGIVPFLTALKLDSNTLAATLETLAVAMDPVIADFGRTRV